MLGRVFPRPTHPVVRLLGDIRDGVRHLIRDVHDLKETHVADFTALNAKLDEQDAARTAATERIAEDVQALKDQIAALQLDTDDQAQIDAVVDRIQGNVDALNAIDPVRADDTDPQPEQPTA